MNPWVRATLQDLSGSAVDLLVIGGGITGAGIAREAALAGLAVALVDARDFGAGTSSRSSRLIHGGLRYLEHGHLRLVFEAVRERSILLRLAPHLVRPLPFVLPTYKGDRVPRWKIAAGLTLYDLLAAGGNVPRHRTLGKRALLQRDGVLLSRQVDPLKQRTGGFGCELTCEFRSHNAFWVVLRAHQTDQVPTK